MVIVLGWRASFCFASSLSLGFYIKDLSIIIPTLIKSISFFHELPSTVCTCCAFMVGSIWQGGASIFKCVLHWSPNMLGFNAQLDLFQ